MSIFRTLFRACTFLKLFNYVTLKINFIVFCWNLRVELSNELVNENLKFEDQLCLCQYLFILKYI